MTPIHLEEKITETRSSGINAPRTRRKAMELPKKGKHNDSFTLLLSILRLCYHSN